jgi:hypothetical protein
LPGGWARFRIALEDTAFHIEETGDLETGMLIDIKRNKGARGVWVAIGDREYRERTENRDYMKVDMHWLAKGPRNEPYASRAVAREIEKLLTDAGATCVYARVSEDVDEASKDEAQWEARRRGAVLPIHHRSNSPRETLREDK